MGGVLSGQVALVTGGGRRIGRGIALALGGAGADVAVTFLASEGEAAGVVAELRGLGVRGLAVRCDVRDEASVGEAVGRVIGDFGGVDVLVNNAGVFEAVRLEEISVAQWDAMFETNARGPFLMAKAAYASLKARRGRIVNVGSLGGSKAWVTHGHYCASKAALHSLTETMAKAWGPEICVNCVAPGMILEGGVRVAERTPLGRIGTMEDVAGAVLWFAAGAGFVTGQVLGVDGGLGL